MATADLKIQKGKKSPHTQKLIILEDLKPSAADCGRKVGASSREQVLPWDPQEKGTERHTAGRLVSSTPIY